MLEQVVLNKLDIIHNAGLYGQRGNIETPEALLKEVWHMVDMITSSYHEFYTATNGKIMLGTDLLSIAKPYLKGDLEETSFLANLVKTTRAYFDCTEDEALLMSFKYNNYEEHEVMILDTFKEVADLLEVIDGNIVYPERWLSPLVYKKIGTILSTFDFERIKVKERVGYSPCGEFTAVQTLEMLKELDGLSLSDEFNYFPTPQLLVDRVLELADIQDTDYVLEPSSGTLSLLKGLDKKHITCIELSKFLANFSKNKGYKTFNMGFEDFTNEEKYDKIIMNPPYNNNMHFRHVIKAFTLLREGGRLVAVLPVGWLNRETKNKDVVQIQKLYGEHGSHKEEFNNGEFKKSGKGTLISTMIIVLDK